VAPSNTPMPVMMGRFPWGATLESQVCHCFGVFGEAVLVTLRGSNHGSGWGHGLSQSVQAVARPDTFSPQA